MSIVDGVTVCDRCGLTMGAEDGYNAGDKHYCQACGDAIAPQTRPPEVAPNQPMRERSLAVCFLEMVAGFAIIIGLIFAVMESILGGIALMIFGFGMIGVCELRLLVNMGFERGQD